MSHDKEFDKTDEEEHWQAWKGGLPAANVGKIKGLNFCPNFVENPRVSFLCEGHFGETEWKYPLP